MFPSSEPSRRRSAARERLAGLGPSPAKGQGAVFFDRDGTLNEEIGHVRNAEDFRVYSFAARAVRLVNEAGLRAIVVTNQSGIARGLIPESLVRRVNRQLTRRIAAGGGKLDAIYYCPHHPEASVERFRVVCECRKPAPGLLEAAAREFGVDLARSFMIGDRFVDMLAGKRAGARSVLVLTGVGRTELEDERINAITQPDHVAENAYKAVRWILANLQA
jgi:D-glycero-D-manno-heptose 1,7-bisphosphate phosphatase